MSDKKINQVLRIGDRVRFSIGGQGGISKVTEIDRVNEGEKYGVSVETIQWVDVAVNAVVTLENGHWAYGHQITRI